MINRDGGSASRTWFGSEVLVGHNEGVGYRQRLRGRRVGILAHPASLDRDLRPVWDQVALLPGVRVTALFGPQHGFVGDKQDNMVESADTAHDRLGAPVFSLYGDTRRLREEWIDLFDILLVDVQDVGVRVYTFLTTVAYLLEDLADRGDKEIWILDRPNPVGRAVVGHRLMPGNESFVGVAEIPMQHGLTVGEFARWYANKHVLNTRLEVVPMVGWSPELSWPSDHVWVQPSPNMPGLYTARAYPGTVMLEGTTVSEARGTTRPLSMFGHPDLNWSAVHRWLAENEPAVFDGTGIRQVVFQPTFHKHAGLACTGYELVAEGRFYEPLRFRPYRLVAKVLKAIRSVHASFPLWTAPPYEYEYERLPIDVITGSDLLRRWVDDQPATGGDLEKVLAADEQSWRQEAGPYYLYGDGR